MQWHKHDSLDYVMPWLHHQVELLGNALIILYKYTDINLGIDLQVKNAQYTIGGVVEPQI